jgi:hypothetical protein
MSTATMRSCTGVLIELFMSGKRKGRRPDDRRP